MRRFEPIVDRLELVATSTDPLQTLGTFVSLPSVTRVLQQEGPQALVIARDVVVSLLVAGPHDRGRALMRQTGSEAHLEQLRRLAEARGLDLELDESSAVGRRPPVSEHEIYAELGLAFIPPELRQGQGEIEAAADGALPDLVERSHIRGDLHVHSDWSDGRDTIEAMVRRAKALGYEYLAITDHSPNAGTARSVNAERLLAQSEEIDRAQEAVPGIAVLRGSEVDILPSGALDLPDRTLERLDIVLASLHDPAGHSIERLTARYLAAMRHPLVTVVTHPANRIVGHHDGYALDFDVLFDAAIETETVLEIDGAPIHLDLDGSLARRAVAAGAQLSVDSDSHSTVALARQMMFGVGTARRGWVEPRHVINTLPLTQLRQMLGRKRTGNRGSSGHRR